MAKIDIQQLYDQYYGYVGRPLNRRSVERAVSSQLPSTRSNALGTPVFMPCTLGGVELPNEPLISVSGSKKIVRTEIDGHEGTFKELYSTGDYQVRIWGIATSEDNSDEYPEEVVRQLRSLCERTDSLKVVNKLLSYFNINQLVIRDYDFRAVEGAQAYQPYTLDCLSDKTFELELRNP